MVNTYAPPLIDDPEKFLHTLLVLGALVDYAGTETYCEPQPPATPYVGNPGQRPGESYTAYRIRLRKEQAT